jgi:hypothetical protein
MTAIKEKHSRTREVRGNDLPNHAKWFSARVREVVFLRLDDLSMDLVCPACVVPDRADRQLEVHSFGGSKSLAGVESLDRSQFIEVLFHEVGEPVEVLAAFFSGNLEAPSVFKGLLGSDDGGVNVLGCTLSDKSYTLSIRFWGGLVRSA